MNIKAKHFQKKLNVNGVVDYCLSKIFTHGYGRGVFEFISKFALNFRFGRSVENKIDFLKNYYRKAELVPLPFGCIQFQGHGLYEITASFETRPAYITSNKQDLTATFYLDSDKTLRFGMFVLEDLNNKTLKECEVIVSLKLFFTEARSYTVKRFSIPIGKSKHGIFGCCNRRNWLDLYFPIRGFSSQYVEMSLSAEMKEGAFLMYKGGMDIHRKTKNIQFHQSVAWSPPFLSSDTIKNNKKIILLSIESLTDPDWISRNFDLEICMPSINALKKDGLSFSCAIPQVDCTRPFVSSILYGLYPSQHRFGLYGSYKPVSNKLKSISSILKEKGFYTVAATPYDHFSADFGFARGFDSYYSTSRPEMNNAPDMAWILRSINSSKHLNQFIYSHIQRLHPPMLSLDDRQYPNSVDINALDSAYKSDFIPLYLKQLESVDRQIGELTSMLKATNQYDNTMIVILGDHGVGMYPWWKKSNNEYSHYEMRGRVPLVIKDAKWFQKGRDDNKTDPVDATIKAFDSIIEAAGGEFPGYVRDSRKIRNKLTQYAIMETIHHPKYNNYSISLRSKEYKFWIEFEMDWSRKKIIKETKVRLYSVDVDTLDANEEVDISKNQDECTIGLLNAYKGMAKDFVKNNLSDF